MNKSESIKNFADAMSKFQGEVKNPPKSADNPFFKSKYTPLDVLIDAAKPLLMQNGLSYIQSCSGDGQNIIVTTLLMHSSGEWVESDPLTLKADKATAQGAGSAITYGRRYALAAALGLASDEDDDGNGAEGNGKKGKQETPTKQNTPPQQSDTDIISEAQRKRLYAISKDGDKAKEIIAKYGYSSSKDIKKVDYEKICKEIEA